MRKLGITGLQGNSCWVGGGSRFDFMNPQMDLEVPQVSLRWSVRTIALGHVTWIMLGVCLLSFLSWTFFSRPLKACPAVLGWTGDRLGNCLHAIIITIYDDLCEGQVVSWRPHQGWADLWEEARLKWSFFLGDRRGRRTLEVSCAGGRGQIHGSLGDMAEIRIRGVDEGSVIQEIGSPIKILVLNL